MQLTTQFFPTLLPCAAVCLYQFQNGRVVQWTLWPAVKGRGMLEPKQSGLIVVPYSCLHGFQEVWSLSQWEGLRERGKWGGRHIAQTGGGWGATKESPVNYIQWEGLWRRLGPCRARVLGRKMDSTHMYIACEVSTQQY